MYVVLVVVRFAPWYGVNRVYISIVRWLCVWLDTTSVAGTTVGYDDFQGQCIQGSSPSFSSLLTAKPFPLLLLLLTTQGLFLHLTRPAMHKP
jgi:hypothetical protein